jgi:type II protein arginine methyltransferase
MACLVGGPELEARFFVGRAGGFDLSAFNRFAPQKMAVDLDQVPWTRLSADLAPFRFDFQNRRLPEARTRLEVPVTAAGRAVGVAQWISLDLDAETVLANTPGGGFQSGWTHVVHAFDAPVDLEAGQVVVLEAEHNRLSVDLSLVEVNTRRSCTPP